MIILLHCYFSSAVAFVGFSEPSFTALEDGGSVTVCIELCTGTTNKPIDVLLYTEDDTAIGIIHRHSVRKY